MEELQDLYQEVILDHNRNPRNFGPLPGATHSMEGFNPLCGDRIHLHLKTNGNVIEEARFEGQGCAISTASASLMTEAIKGKRVEQAEQLFSEIHHLLTGDAPADEDRLDKLIVLSGVRNFPTRVKCASLPWHALNATLTGEEDSVSTE
ncbi:MAG: SUF system NifU family Fe-S cluster assembly protein [Pseudomonadota bacterium]|nr:SUF system NifU family Fe-S cluster assembly protein [Pseudomonadota bacterium]